MPEEPERTWVGRAVQNLALKRIYEGLGIEFVRDLIKGALMYSGGIGFAVLLSGLGDITWSLTSFNIFGTVNTVEEPNQKIGSEAVYRLPFDTSVRLEGGGFLAISRGHREQIEAVLTDRNGSRKDQYITPTSPMFEVFGCDRVGVQLMELPEEDADSALVLYTKARVDSDECRGFWQSLLR